MRWPIPVWAFVMVVALAGARAGSVFADEASCDLDWLPPEISAATAAEMTRAIALAELRALFDEADVDIRAGAWWGLRRCAPDDAQARIDLLAASDWETAPRGGGRLRFLVQAGDLRAVFTRISASPRSDLAAIGNAGLARSGDAKAAERLGAAMRSSDAEIAGPARAAAVRARLTELLGGFESRRKGRGASLESVAAVARLTADEAERRRSIRALRRHVLARPDARSSGAAAAIEALGALARRDAEARAALWTIAGSAPTEERRALAELELGRAGEAGVAERLLARIRNAPPQGAMAEARVLGDLGVREFLPGLRSLLDDARSSQRWAAAVAFARAGGMRDGARELARCLRRARDEGAIEARLEIALAMAGAGGEGEMAMPPIQIELDEPCGATRDERAARLARACARLAQAIGALTTGLSIETPLPDVILVAIPADADRPAIVAAAAAALADADQGFRVTVTGSWGAVSTGVGPTGRSP